MVLIVVIGLFVSYMASISNAEVYININDHNYEVAVGSDIDKSMNFSGISEIRASLFRFYMTFPFNVSLNRASASDGIELNYFEQPGQEDNAYFFTGWVRSGNLPDAFRLTLNFKGISEGMCYITIRDIYFSNSGSRPYLYIGPESYGIEGALKVVAIAQPEVFWGGGGYLKEGIYGSNLIFNNLSGMNGFWFWIKYDPKAMKFMTIPNPKGIMFFGAFEMGSGWILGYGVNDPLPSSINLAVEFQVLKPGTASVEVNVLYFFDSVKGLWVPYIPNGKELTAEFKYK